MHAAHGRDLPRLIAAYRTIEAPTLVVAVIVNVYSTPLVSPFTWSGLGPVTT